MTTAEAISRLKIGPKTGREIDYVLEAKSPQARRNFVLGMLDNADKTPHPALRYRMVLDAAMVWRKKDPRLVALRIDKNDLFSPFERLDDSGPASVFGDEKDLVVRQRVFKAVAAVKESTWNSFSEMAGSAFGQRIFDLTTSAGIENFEKWFKTARPYFTWDLPSDLDQAKAEFEKRKTFLETRVRNDDNRESYVERIVELLYDDLLDWHAQLSAQMVTHS